MSQLRFGFLWGAVWVCLFVLVVGPWWVGLFGSGSYPLIRLFEFIQGDLCLSAHIAPVPVQKKKTVGAFCFAPLTSAQTKLCHIGCWDRFGLGWRVSFVFRVACPANQQSFHSSCDDLGPWRPSVEKKSGDSRAEGGFWSELHCPQSHIFHLGPSGSVVCASSRPKEVRSLVVAPATAMVDRPVSMAKAATECARCQFWLPHKDLSRQIDTM